MAQDRAPKSLYEALRPVWVHIILTASARGRCLETLDDLERCRVFRPLVDHLVDNAPLHRHFPG
jgi:hypothetical protein